LPGAKPGVNHARFRGAFVSLGFALHTGYACLAG